jgi:copper chaperone NosL
MKINRIIILFASSLVLWAIAAFGDDLPTLKPSPDDKCPVCGMFVHKYPDWVSEITFTDGSHVFFDGVKDMLKYYHNLEKYHPSKSQSDIKSLYVTEYYDMTVIEARNAWFVAGSDVFGPMGRELIPLKNREDAENFKKDHNGSMIYDFDEITPAVLLGLDH